MADKREQILVRLEDILALVEGIETVARNRGLMSNDKRPAIILLDGDESVTVQSPRRSNYPGLTPTINRARPEIYVLLKEERPTNITAGGKTVGTELNRLRIDITTRIATDAALLALMGSNGGMRYLGCATDLKSGSSLSGEMRLDFSFDYVFDPL